MTCKFIYCKLNTFRSLQVSISRNLQLEYVNSVHKIKLNCNLWKSIFWPRIQKHDGQKEHFILKSTLYGACYSKLILLVTNSNLLFSKFYCCQELPFLIKVVTIIISVISGSKACKKKIQYTVNAKSISSHLQGNNLYWSPRWPRSR